MYLLLLELLLLVVDLGAILAHSSQKVSQEKNRFTAHSMQQEIPGQGVGGMPQGVGGKAGGVGGPAAASSFGSTTNQGFTSLPPPPPPPVQQNPFRPGGAGIGAGANTSSGGAGSSVANLNKV